MAARWAQRMMPTTRQDFWVLYLREIMMRPRSSRDLSSALFTYTVKKKPKGDLGRMRGWSERLRLITTAYDLRCNFKNPANPRRRHRIVNWKGWINCALKFSPPAPHRRSILRVEKIELNVDGLPAAIGKMTSSQDEESFAINICLIPNPSRNHPSGTDSSHSEDDHNGNCSHGELWFSR